jgi:hypothetical protein
MFMELETIVFFEKSFKNSPALLYSSISAKHYPKTPPTVAAL